MKDEKFEQIYKKTYRNVLKYIICNCTNVEDTNDLLQETYFSYYRAYKKGKVIDNDYYYLIGIAHKKINEFYRKKYKWKNLLFSLIRKDSSEEETNLLDIVPSNFDLEKIIIQKYELNDFTQFLFSKKPIIIKTFYLYFYFDMTTKEVSNELNINESTIKSYLYRTLKEYRKLQEGE